MLFKDKYFFLSTFYPAPFTLSIGDKECKFMNVEAAYQAQKNPQIADKFSQIKGLEAKRMNNDLIITVPNWDKYKLYAMGNALHAKFTNKILFAQLRAIKEDIINDNYWGDKYWGVSKGEGKNILGKMLMNIRNNNNDKRILYNYISTELIGEDDK